MREPKEENQYTPWQVRKLEELETTSESIYFDVDDFEEIVDFYVARGNYNRALRVVDYALNLHGNSTPLTLRKAQLLASLNREDKALELLAKLEDVDTDEPDILLTRAAIYSQQQKFEKAIEEYKKALENN